MCVEGSVLRIRYLHGSLTFARAHTAKILAVNAVDFRRRLPLPLSHQRGLKLVYCNVRRLIIKVKWGKNRSSGNTIKVPWYARSIYTYLFAYKRCDFDDNLKRSSPDTEAKDKDVKRERENERAEETSWELSSSRKDRDSSGDPWSKKLRCSFESPSTCSRTIMESSNLSYRKPHW